MPLCFLYQKRIIMEKSTFSLPDINFTHAVDIQIRFNDIDGLNHVNNAVQLFYFDFGRMNYFSEILGDRINWEDPGMVVASVKNDYIRPIYINEKIEVCSKVTNIGNKSMHMLQCIREKVTGEIKTVSHSVMVGFNRKEDASMAIKDFWREKILAFEKGDVIL